VSAPIAPPERRRVERRVSHRVADLTLPEARRIIVTTLLFAIVLTLFLRMVQSVIVAAILAIVIAVYTRPLYRWFRARFGARTGPAAIVTLLVIILPTLGALAYSYNEVVDVVQYVSENQAGVAARIEAAVRRLPFMAQTTAEDVRGWVARAVGYGAEIPDQVRDALVGFSVGATIFLFTAFYVYTSADEIGAYVREKIPPRYSEIVGTFEHNVRGVLYGAIYATLLTQTLKSVLIFGMNLAFGVPLAGVLAILSFIIGFFPIVGSWSVYLPVALWLFVWQGRTVAAVAMVATGFLLNTVLISTFLRPKIAAEKSGVLNFYWMFVGLVTGVYTFGLPGILLGPILIGLLKAAIDTVTARQSWRLLDDEGEVLVAGVVGADGQPLERP
jgi:predicted PurR-regulated permease PerM